MFSLRVTADSSASWTEINRSISRFGQKRHTSSNLPFLNSNNNSKLLHVYLIITIVINIIIMVIFDSVGRDNKVV